MTSAGARWREADRAEGVSGTDRDRFCRNRRCAAVAGGDWYPICLAPVKKYFCHVLLCSEARLSVEDPPFGGGRRDNI